MHKKVRHKVSSNPAIFQRVVYTDNALPDVSKTNWSEDQIRFVRTSAVTLNQETEHVLDIIADSLRAKLANITSEDPSGKKHVKIEVYMPIMCSPFCIENENGDEQIIHINAPIQFSPVRITSIDDEPVE